MGRDVGFDIDERAAVDGIETRNLEYVPAPRMQPDDGREHGVRAGRAAGREDPRLRYVRPAHRVHAVDGPALLRHFVPPVEHRDVGVALDTVKQRDTALIEDNLRYRLFRAPDMRPARVGPFPL